MPRTPKHNWPMLIEQFKASGQTQTAFCQEQGLNPSYFNQKLNEGKKKPVSAFAKVERDPKAASEIGIILQVGQCKITCPSTMPMITIANLVRSLA